MRFILASTSPRRRMLFEKLGVPFDQIAPCYRETVQPGLSVEQQVVAFAQAKADSIGILDAFVLGSDTLVAVDNLILGKPVDRADAGRMLSLLRGRTHKVVTGVALMVPCGTTEVWYETSKVRMREISDEERDAYLDSEEPFGKAGAYAIQGKGGRLIEQVEGEYENIVGLPLQSVAAALLRYGFPVLKNNAAPDFRGALVKECG